MAADPGETWRARSMVALKIWRPSVDALVEGVMPKRERASI
jgi:hypothetical protein